MNIIANLLINGLAVFIAAYLLNGVHIDSFITAVIAAVVLGITNTIIKPIFLVLTLPINILTLGLFTFIVNALMILLVSSIVSGFEVDSFLWAFLFSIVLSLVNIFLKSLKKDCQNILPVLNSYY